MESHPALLNYEMDLASARPAALVGDGEDRAAAERCEQVRGAALPAAPNERDVASHRALGAGEAADDDRMLVDLLAANRIVDRPSERIAADDAQDERFARPRLGTGGPGDVAGEFGKEGRLDRILRRLGTRRRRSQSKAEQEEGPKRLEERSALQKRSLVPA
jgi:hypothetical protein